MDYRGMMRDAVAFIEAEIKEDIRPEDVSERLFFSLPHVYRIFRSVLGCSIKEYIRRRRLSLAAEALLSSRVKIIDLALDLRYESPETFLRAFKSEYGLTPSAFRRQASMAPLFPAPSLSDAEGGGREGIEPRIVFHKRMPLSGLRLRTSLSGGRNLAEIPPFWDRLGREGFLRPEIEGEAMYGLYADWAGEDDFTLAVGREARQGGDFEIPASKYAVFALEPFDPSGIPALWDYIYGEWFLRTGCERTERLVDFERYANGFSSYEIFVPLP
jgi:AraC family transcriptional regulator